MGAFGVSGLTSVAGELPCRGGLFWDPPCESAGGGDVMPWQFQLPLCRPAGFSHWEGMHDPVSWLVSPLTSSQAFLGLILLFHSLELSYPSFEHKQACLFGFPEVWYRRIHGAFPDRLAKPFSRGNPGNRGFEREACLPPSKANAS